MKCSDPKKKKSNEGGLASRKRTGCRLEVQIQLAL